MVKWMLHPPCESFQISSHLLRASQMGQMVSISIPRPSVNIGVRFGMNWLFMAVYTVSCEKSAYFVSAISFSLSVGGASCPAFERFNKHNQ